MRISILFTTLFTGLIPAVMSANVPNISASLQSRPAKLAYERISDKGHACVRVYNFTDSRKGFVLYSGDDIIGYCPEGDFDVNTAPPALVAILESITAAPAATTDNGRWSEVTPLSSQKGYVMWNQDSPFNDRCPEYEIGKRAPSGCVATAMAQVMFYHQWPETGTGSHTYSPAVLHGNTLSADFGNTEYAWDKMEAFYSSFSDEESRAAVAELMLHCGVAVDMFYYSQSGATDYDVPPALVNYFGYDRSLAYRKREHYSTTEWLRVIHDELVAGRPILAYGKSSMGGHAFVFDGMDSDGFIHVNWGWGGMSNGYFNTSVLTPPVQGIGGADGGFNYSQRIITGIRPADAQQGDYHVEITSTESLSPARKKIAQGGEVKIKLSGKVYNHGWRDAEFDYALLLTDREGNMVGLYKGPEGCSLEVGANAYAPDFGTISFGTLVPGEYTLTPVVRTSGGTGEWIPVRDEYIGYPNILRVTATENDIVFESCDYYSLRTTEIDVPETIWSGMPTLITTSIINDGDVEYHGEIRAAIYDKSKEIATTSNYIIDLGPGETTDIRFTDSFSVADGQYTLALVNDDGQKISSPVTVIVRKMNNPGNVSSAAKASVIESSPGKVVAKCVLKADALVQGLLYGFIYDANGNVQQGCLYPEYISLDENDRLEVTLAGEFENGIPGKEYCLKLAVYFKDSYTFLKDENSTTLFTLAGGSSVGNIYQKADEGYRYYDFNGFEVDPRNTKLYKKVKKHHN